MSIPLFIPPLNGHPQLPLPSASSRSGGVLDALVRPLLESGALIATAGMPSSNLPMYSYRALDD